MHRPLWVAAVLVVFGLSSLVVAQQLSPEPRGGDRLALVLVLGSGGEAGASTSAVSPAMLRLTSRSHLTCQTVLSLGSVSVGESCQRAAPRLATALAD